MERAAQKGPPTSSDGLGCEFELFNPINIAHRGSRGRFTSGIWSTEATRNTPFPQSGCSLSSGGHSFIHRLSLISGSHALVIAIDLGDVDLSDTALSTDSKQASRHAIGSQYEELPSQKKIRSVPSQLLDLLNWP
jgi:hypothetical protein